MSQILVRTQKSFSGSPARGLPQFDRFKHNSCRIRDRNPDENSLDGELLPGADGETHHLPRLIAPPAVGHCQRRLPEEAYKQDDEKCQAQGRQLINGRTAGKKPAAGTMPTATRNMKYPGNPSGLLEKNFL
jgi:hypothetical protein